MSRPPASRAFARAACLVLAASLAACGDRSSGPQTPEGRVAAVVVFPDTLWLDVGDTARVQAQPLDRAGAPVDAAAVTWSGGGSVTVDATGRVLAAVAGVGTVRARSGAAEGTLPVLVRVPIDRVVLERDADTVDAVGVRTHYAIEARAGNAERAGRYVVTALDTGVVLAVLDVTDAMRPAIAIQSLRQGDARVEVRDHAGAADTLRMSVRQRVTSVALCACNVVIAQGRLTPLQHIASDRNRVAVPGATLTWASRDSGVVRVSATGVLDPRARGMTHVLARTSSGAVDSVSVTVGAPPAVSMPGEFIVIGAGGSATGLFVQTGNDGAAAGLAFTVDDSSLVALQFTREYWGAVLTVSGRRAGVARIVATAPGLAPDTLRVEVQATRLHLRAWPGLGDGHVETTAGRDARVDVGIRTLAGTAQVPSVTVPVQVRSSDTTVFTAPTPSVVLSTQPNAVFGTTLRLRAPGRAWLVATAPGFAPESLMVVALAAPRLRFTPGRVLHLAAGFRWTQNSRPGIGTSQDYDKAPLVARLEHRGSAVTDVPDSVAIPPGWPAVPFAGTGVRVGVDTLIATALGYAPDTTIIVVGAPVLRNFPDSVSAEIGSGAWIMFIPTDSSGGELDAVAPVSYAVSTSDARVARPAPRVEITPGTWWFTYFDLGVRDSGTAIVTITDPAGAVAPQRVRVRATLDTTLAFSFAYTYRPTGATQRFDQTAFYVTVPEGKRMPMTVRMRSTDPGVLVVPDSLVLGWRVTSPLIRTGARPGTASIVLTAPGYRDVVTPPITVERSRLDVVRPDTVYARGTGYSLVVRSRTPAGQQGVPDESVPLQLSPLDAGLSVAAPQATIAAGTTQVGPLAFAASAPGTHRLEVRDTRGADAPYAPDTAHITVVAPPLRFWQSRLFVPLGMRGRFSVERPDALAHEASSLALTKRGGRTAIEAPGAMASGSRSATFGIVGRGLGTDTIQASAPGYASATTLLQVVPGRAGLEGVPFRMTVGSSAAVRMYLGFDVFGRSGFVADALTTVTVRAAEGLAVRRGDVSVSSLAVLAGEVGGDAVRLHALAPGTWTVTLSRFDYETTTYTVEVVAP